MAIQISISNAIGSRYRGSVVPPIDPDAQAFITAASITDPTQQAAINTLVVDLKGYSIWSKMKAIYPFVGGTASTHKWNLKDPRDLDAAFRLQFLGGWTHSSAGALQNAFCYADTKFTPSGNITATSAHHSAYLRVNRTIAQQAAYGSYTGTTADMQLYPYSFSIGWINDLFDNSQSRISVNTGNSTGFIVGSRASSSSHKLFRNGSSIASTTNNTNGTPPNIPYYIGAVNLNGIASFYDIQQFAFASIGDGLTDTEAANLYTAVQAFQTTLGRSIGTQTVSDADAQAFVTNAGIVDQVEANAINNLVIGLKADGLWTKMKAVYPMVGGSSSTMKYNLKNPLDTDAAFRLVFNGGGNWDANGYTPNGSNGYADTKFNPVTNSLAYNNNHLSYYSRTQVGSANAFYEMGSGSSANGGTSLFCRRSNDTAAYDCGTAASNRLLISPVTDGRGFYVGSGINTNVGYLFKNGTQQQIKNPLTNVSMQSYNYYLGAFNEQNSTVYYSDKQCAFASIGDGLTVTEAANFYTAVQAFQVALSRNI